MSRAVLTSAISDVYMGNLVILRLGIVFFRERHYTKLIWMKEAYFLFFDYIDMVEQ